MGNDAHGTEGAAVYVHESAPNNSEPPPSLVPTAYDSGCAGVLQPMVTQTTPHRSHRNVRIICIPFVNICLDVAETLWCAGCNASSRREL